MLASSTARARIGAAESNGLSLALRERVFSSEARGPCFPYIPGCENAWSMQQRGCCSRRLERCRGRSQRICRRAYCRHSCVAAAGITPRGRWRICGWHFRNGARGSAGRRTRHGAANLVDGAEFTTFRAIRKRISSAFVLVDGLRISRRRRQAAKGSYSDRAHERLGARPFAQIIRLPPPFSGACH